MANCLQLHRSGLDDVLRVFTQSVIGVRLDGARRGRGSSRGLPQLTREFLWGFFFGGGGWWERHRVHPPSGGLITGRGAEYRKQPRSFTLRVVGGPELREVFSKLGFFS